MQPDHPTHRDNANPPVIPDHTLLRPIGRGAYGEVWLARNVMGALRAVKIIWRRQFESDRPYEREFTGIQRYEPVSRSSGGLVHVLHVGRHEADGYFYYVMELADAAEVPGAECQISGDPPATRQDTSHLTPDAETPDTYSPRTLRSDLKQLGRLPTDDCLRLAIDVVSGLAQLHRRGLIHRDVKPGNIIYVHGRAKLADIGLVSTGGEGRTFVGTEGYIPPEGPGAAAADLYALGVALYEASTGHSPEKFPDVPPEWFNDDAGNEALEFHEVILKACEGQRERRYESTEAMQADLALLQSGQSVRHVRALERRYARLRRSGIVGSILLACTLITVVFVNYRARLAEESRLKEARLRAQAQQSLARAESAELDARQQLYTALLEQARATVRSGELGQRINALDAIRRAAAISNTIELRREVFAALALPDLRSERGLTLETNVTLLELDPSFERLALCKGNGPVEIRAVSDNRLLTALPASTNLLAYAGLWSSDGRFLAVKRDWPPNGRRADLEVWDVTGARLALRLTDVSWNARSFHPQRHWIMAAQPGSVAIWDLESGRELKRFPFSMETVHLVKFSPDGERFAAHQVFSTQSIVTVHSAITGAVILSREFSEFVGMLAWHPGGQSLAIADFGGGVHLLDTLTEETRTLGQHKAQAVTLAFSPDGHYLISGGWERELICWDMRARQRAFVIGLDSYQLQFSADGHRCATFSQMTASTDATYSREIRIHTFERMAGFREYREDLGSQLRSATFSRDGRWLAASAGRRAGVWDLTGNELGALDNDAYVTKLGFTADGRELFASRNEARGNECFRWKIMPAINPSMPPRLVRLPLSKPAGFTSLVVHSNAIVFTGTKGTQLLALEEIASGGTRGWSRTSQGLNGVSPDGRWLAIRQSFGDTLHVYRLPGLEEVASLKNPPRIGEFAFSPLGNEVVTCSSALGVATFWRTGTWDKVRVVPDVIGLFYAPDARGLWLTRDWRTGGLYDASTLELLLPLPIGMLPLALSPDGRRLAVSVDLRRLQVWDLEEVRNQLAQLGLDWRE